jgi:hypothetical protein
MFGFRRKRAEVLNHWIAFADGFQMAPSEFYAALEKQLADRKMPEMRCSRVELAQGGLLFEKRIYLRMVRERFVFDVCAAPFGTGFFFSCRTAENPERLNLWQLLTLLVVVPVVSLLFSQFLLLDSTRSFSPDIARIVVFTFFSVLTLFLALVFGVIFSLRRETYYRIDSRLCYLHMIPTLVRKLAEDMSATQGIKLMEQFELSPVLGELYKPARRETVDLNISVDNPPLPSRPRVSM